MLHVADDNYVKEKFAYVCRQEHGMQVLERFVNLLLDDILIIQIIYMKYS